MEFNYKARNASGSVQTGVVKASDEDNALEILKKNDLDVFYLEEAAPKGLDKKIRELFSFVSQKELVIFSRQLSIMIESSVPIIKALRIIGKQTDNQTLSQICFAMAKHIEEGDAFSDALSRYPKQFDKFYISIIKSGEASGNLRKALLYLANHLEDSYELQSKIKSALMYPAFIITAFTGIFFFLTIYVLPKLTEILKDSGVELPWTTKIVILVSDFMNQHWLIVLVLLFGLVGGAIYAVRTEKGKQHFDAVILAIPVIGKVVQYSYIARFAENLRILLEGGVNIVNSLKIISEVMDNVIYQDVILRIVNNVEKGKGMADAMFEDNQAFPLMVPQMLKIGEESGRTSEVLQNIEDFYTREVNQMTDSMTTIIEPILIVVLGAGTGILVAAIIMPIYDMAGSV